MKTYVDVIKETVAFYSEDTNRRSVSSGGICLYNGPDGKQCAVARCSVGIDAEYENKGAFYLIEKLGMEILKKEYRHLTNLPFWTRLQGLHDRHINWDGNGLTQKGEYVVEKLLEIYENK